MALIVEDGTGVADANSYASVEFADAYFAERGITTWAGDSNAKSFALIRATDYIEGRFGLKFKGVKLTLEQGLCYPRTGPFDGVPLQLKRAVCEYALRAQTAKLAPDLVASPTGQAVVSVSKKLGPLENTTQYSDTQTPQAFRVYPEADMLLRGLLRTGAGVIR